MLIGFTGASGRTDASHAAHLAAHAFAALGVGTTLLVGGSSRADPSSGDGSLKVVRVPTGDRPATALRRARAACGDADRLVIADVPPAWVVRDAVRRVIDLAIVAVGPHEADEREAAALVGRLAAPRTADRPWYLGCRRAGGGPAAVGFAEAMANLDPASRTLPCALPPLGRGEAAALGRSIPGGRTLRAGILLARAIHEAAAPAGPAGCTPLAGEARDEAERIALTADSRSLPDRLRDLADDAEAVAAGLGPTAADLAGAPVLDGWARDVVATPILKGHVTGHPDIAEGHRVRTSEVFLTDRATWARTLSRWYVLRSPSGAPAAGMQ